MAIKDRAVTIKGDAAKVTCITIYPQSDGNCVIVNAGVTQDSDGRPVALKESRLIGDTRTNAVLASFLDVGLAALRRVNGLEDSDEPEGLAEKVVDASPAAPAVLTHS